MINSKCNARDTTNSYPPVFQYLTKRVRSDKIAGGVIYSLIVLTNKLQFVAIHLQLLISGDDDICLI